MYGLKLLGFYQTVYVVLLPDHTEGSLHLECGALRLSDWSDEQEVMIKRRHGWKVWCVCVATVTCDCQHICCMSYYAIINEHVAGRPVYWQES